MAKAGSGPARTECLAEWRVTNARGGPDATGHVSGRQRCKDGDSGCDADGTADGTCTFTVAPCFNRTDARFARCAAQSISTWTLGGKVDPGSPAVIALIASVAALGPSTVDATTVTFTPALATADVCGDPVAVAVPVHKRVVLRSRAAGTDGGARDGDVLKLACTP